MLHTTICLLLQAFKVLSAVMKKAEIGGTETEFNEKILYWVHFILFDENKVKSVGSILNHIFWCDLCKIYVP